MKKILALCAIAMLPCLPAHAQVQAPTYQGPNGETKGGDGVFPLDSTNGPSFSRREVFLLASANVASAAVNVYGGTYLLNQVCGGYGTVQFQSLGPDGVTYQTVASYTSASTTGGLAVQMGSFQTVRVVLSGTTACNIKLSRVPA
jgi:hypothetical protein